MNQGYRYRTRARRPASVLDWLCSEFPHSTAAEWQARIDGGEVASPGAVLRVGDEVTWSRPPWEEPAVPTEFEVVYEDEHVLVVDKPPGLPTMPAGGFLEHTLLFLVRQRWPDASPMHRLGRGTSGLVVFGKTAAGRASVQAQWRANEVGKTYRARVEGRPPEAAEVTAPIGPVDHPRLGSVHAACADGRPARSSVRRVGEDAAGSLVDVRIATGRPHQIRIHVAFLGHPLTGDPLYGPGGVPRSDALPGDLGYALRAWKLELRGLDGPLVVEVDPGPDFPAGATPARS